MRGGEQRGDLGGDAWLGSSWCWTLDTGAGGKLKFTLCTERNNKALSMKMQGTLYLNTYTLKKIYLGLREASFDRGVRGSNLKEDKPQGAWKTKP